MTRYGSEDRAGALAYSPHTAAPDEVALDAIRTALRRVDRRLIPERVTLDASLTDDLGLDSLRFVDLTVALEDALHIDAFPIQEWHDAEAAKEGERRFTVASLVASCVQCLEERGRETWPP